MEFYSAAARAEDIGNGSWFEYTDEGGWLKSPRVLVRPCSKQQSRKVARGHDQACVEMRGSSRDDALYLQARASHTFTRPCKLFTCSLHGSCTSLALESRIHRKLLWHHAHLLHACMQASYVDAHAGGRDGCFGNGKPVYHSVKVDDEEGIAPYLYSPARRNSWLVGTPARSKWRSW